MTGLVRKATLLAACGLVVAGAAMAGIPNAANSQKPCIILADFPNSNQFGGVNAGVCAVNALKVIVRDALNNPVANSDVVLDFSTCAATFQLGSTQPDPAITTTCTTGPTVHQVMKTTNALGEVCFSVMGKSTVNDPSNLYPYYAGQPLRNLGPSAGQVCCKIYASGNLMDTKLLIVNSYDLQINGTVNSVDGSYHLDAIGQSAPIGYRTYGDYNCDGAVNSTDGALKLDAIGNNGFSGFPYAGAYCP